MKKDGIGNYIIQIEIYSLNLKVYDDLYVIKNDIFVMIYDDLNVYIFEKLMLKQEIHHI
jgi:hypothetical protein